MDTSEEQRSATLLPRSSPARGAGSLQRPRCRLHQSMPSRRRFSTSAAVALLHDAAVRTSARRRNLVGRGASSPICSGQVARRQRMACAVASRCSSFAGTNYRSLCATGRGGERPHRYRCASFLEIVSRDRKIPRGACLRPPPPASKAPTAASWTWALLCAYVSLRPADVIFFFFVLSLSSLSSSPIRSKKTEVIIAYLFWVVGTTERKPASSKVVGTTFQVPLIP